MNRKAEILYKMGEFLAGGMYEREGDSIEERYALGIRRYFEHAIPPPDTGILYPAPEHDIWHLNGKYVRWHYAFGFNIDEQGLYEAGKEMLTDPFELHLLGYIIEELRYLRSYRISPAHGVGGKGWTHTVLNYPRMLKEGLSGYIARVNRMPDGSLKNALQDTLAGITDFLDRSPGNIRNEVMAPAKDFRHAMRSFNFFFALDSYDSAGRFDDYMGAYYRGETEAPELLRELFRAVELHDGWHLLYTVKYPEFTLICLQNQHFLRPNSGLLVRPDMPQEIWEAVFDLWENGYTNPCLYNEKAYLKSLEYYGSSWADAAVDGLAFGGCTECMIGGCSNVGSIDGGINLLELLLRDGEDQFYESIRKEVEAAAWEIRQQSSHSARYRPHLIRTLFVDDCIDRNLEYNAGGARFNGSVFNVAGLVDAANTLAARRGIDARFGNDDDRVDKIAGELAEYTFGLIRQQNGRGDGAVFPAVILLTYFVNAGMRCDATPDGRAAGEPLTDSIGPAAGTDRNGVTAMLNSVTKLPLELAVGTPVLNMRLQKSLFRESRTIIKALIEVYFKKGGMQMQLSVIDKETLRKAYENPEKYPGLMVRIGGFSAYFCSLTREHQYNILQRTEHII